MLNTSFSPWPCFSEDEANAVKSTLLSNKVNYWTGNKCRKFEKKFASYTGCQYAIALANGTLALDLALKAFGVGYGDDVIVTPRTFLASVSSIVTAGANPIFADVDLNSQNITAESIKAVLTPKVKAVIVVHLAGMPAEMDSIMKLSEENNFYVLEDCAQAHGATYKGRSVGSIGHIGAWSFCQDKIMTTGGEGGMITTNDESLWSAMWSYKDHGKSYDAVYNLKHPKGFRWLHHSFGTNWRMTEMQAAVGLIQIQKMPSWTKIRRLYADRLNLECSKFKSIKTISVPEYITHANYKYYIFVDDSLLKKGWDRERLIEEINNLGVPCYHGVCPEVYLEKAFDNTRWRPPQRLSNAKLLGESSLMFLVHPTLTDAEINLTCSAISSVFSKACLN